MQGGLMQGGLMQCMMAVTVIHFANTASQPFFA